MSLALLDQEPRCGRRGGDCGHCLEATAMAHVSGDSVFGREYEAQSAAKHICICVFRASAPAWPERVDNFATFEEARIQRGSSLACPEHYVALHRKRCLGFQEVDRRSRTCAKLGLRRLTFELSWHRRWDARPGLAKMYRVPPDRAWWPAAGAPLERVVRPQLPPPDA